MTNTDAGVHCFSVSVSVPAISVAEAKVAPPSPAVFPPILSQRTGLPLWIYPANEPKVRLPGWAGRQSSPIYAGDG